MRVLIVSDAWQPQINGVVRTLECTSRVLREMGHVVEVIGPETGSWRTIAAPSYPSIKLELLARPRLHAVIDRFNPDCIHIATEGPLGWAARNLCLKLDRPFTTSYHTRFPEYLEARVPRGLRRPVRLLAYAVLRRFHAPSSAVMVATPSIENDLRARRFRHLVRWVRGVDTHMYRPMDKAQIPPGGLPRPHLLYVGRVAVEKNLEAFLNLDTPGSKIVVGDGPDLEPLKARFPAVHFTGARHGDALARHYADADLFVFPSTTDTFGLVLLEAAASGLRIASFPAPGPADIFADPAARAFAVLDKDLGQAVRLALALPDDPAAPRRYAESFSWEASTRQFAHHLQARTPRAVRRIIRFRNWLARSWQRALALLLK